MSYEIHQLSSSLHASQLLRVQRTEGRDVGHGEPETYVARIGAPVWTARPARPSGWARFSYKGFSGALTSHIRISPFILPGSALFSHRFRDHDSIGSDAPPSDELPLTTSLKMNTLDPCMMLSPDPHHDITGIVHPLVEKTDHTITEPRHEHIPIRFV